MTLRLFRWCLALSLRFGKFSRSPLSPVSAVGRGVLLQQEFRPIVVLILFLVAAPIPAVLAQDPAPPVLRVSTYSVMVDVVVTNKGNRHVTNLTKDDFEIFEDGVPQRVELFQAVNPKIDPTKVEDGKAEFGLESLEPAIVDETAGPNLVIILLDYATVEYLNQSYIREAAIQYVKEKLKPDDLMAVFKVGRSLEFLQGFTNNKQELVAALSTKDTAGTMFAADEQNLTASAENVQDQVEILTAGLDQISGAGTQLSPAMALLAAELRRELDLAQALEGTYYAQRSYGREMQSRPIIGAIETIGRGVRHIPGRKTLILISQGFTVPMTLERPLYRAVDMANKANLAVYAVDGSGLVARPVVSTESKLYDISAMRAGDRVKAYGGLSQFDLARELGIDQRDATLRFIASSTGGLLIRHTNDFMEAFERIDEDVRSHYVLTYHPSNSDFRGEYRTISVRTRNPDHTVRSRAGYWAVPPGASLLTADEFRELLESSDSEKKVSGKPFESYGQLAHFRLDSSLYRVHLTLEVPIDELSPEYMSGIYFVDLDVVGIVQDEYGKVMTSFRAPSRMKLSTGQLSDAKTVRFETFFDLGPGRYSVTLSAGNPVTGRRGFQRRGLMLPQIADGMALSSLVLGSTDELVPAVESDFFTVHEARVTPSAKRVFQNGEKLIYLLNVFNPPAASTEEQGLELVTEVLRGGRVISRLEERVKEPLEEGTLPAMKLARYLELDGLRPGRYLLRTTINGVTAGQSRTAQTAFSVN